MRKSQRDSISLRSLLQADELAFLMEAHSALSAKIVEETGFKAIWASGLTMSATFGLSDRNEASWSQILDVVDAISDHVEIPVLMDGDSGFGDFNNVSRIVGKLNQRGGAGICLEDKLFPKQNSFIGEQQELVDANEFCGKIMAAKDSQLDSDFCVVARTETLVSGRSMEEAYDRASAYHDAGADAILIHSKKSDANEVLDFAQKWQMKAPLIIVPTKYYRQPTADYYSAPISAVIWANHCLRASITAMRKSMEEVYKNQSVLPIEDSIATLDQVFSLTNEFEVQEAVKKYIPSSMGV